MNLLANGKMCFDDVYEMYYDLFTEIGLAINPQNQYLYDVDTGIVLKYKEKYIKATVHPIEIYAGRNDIIFDPARNYNLMTTLFGYYIDKETSGYNGDTIGFISHFTEERNGMREQQRVVVQTRLRGNIVSQYYKNVYLGYIECIFILAGNPNIDLSNLDFVIF